MRTTIGGIAALLLSASLPVHGYDASYAVDRAMIEDLQARYLFALDFRDPAAYAETFAPDGVVQYGVGGIVGGEAIAVRVETVRANADAQQIQESDGLRPAAGRHNITNIVIDVDGDTATATAYWFHMGNANPERSAQLNSFGHYEDELVKIDGEWYFSKRKIYNEQIAEWAASGDNPVVNPGPGPRQRSTSAD